MVSIHMDIQSGEYTEYCGEQNILGFRTNLLLPTVNIIQVSLGSQIKSVIENKREFL